MIRADSRPSDFFTFGRTENGRNNRAIRWSFRRGVFKDKLWRGGGGLIWDVRCTLWPRCCMQRVSIMAATLPMIYLYSYARYTVKFTTAYAYYES